MLECQFFVFPIDIFTTYYVLRLSQIRWRDSLYSTSQEVSSFFMYEVTRPNGGSRMVRNVRKGSEDGAYRHRGYKKRAE